MRSKSFTSYLAKQLIETLIFLGVFSIGYVILIEGPDDAKEVAASGCAAIWALMFTQEFRTGRKA